VRSYVVFVVLVFLLIGGFYAIVTRTREAHVAPEPEIVAVVADDGGADAAAVFPSFDSGALDAADVTNGIDAGPPGKLTRPLRVAALGGDVAAPGLVEPGGALAVTAVEKTSDIESRLGRGGADADGADLAVVPLASFVASYDKLKALAPEVFLVVGWSRGREVILGSSGATLTKLPRTDEVRVTSGGAESPTMLALVAFDAVGVPPEKVRVLPFAPDDKKPFFVMAERASIDAGAVGAGPSGQKILLTSADASRAVPLVAFAAHAFLEAHPDDVAAFAKHWLAGNARVKADAAAASRTIAAMPQAPEAVVLLERLGQMEPAAAEDLAVEPLQEIVRHEMELWRAAGSGAGGALGPVPVATSTLASLAKAGPADAGAKPAPGIGPRRGGNVLLVRREAPADGKVDEEALGATIAWLVTVFDRSTVRVTVKGAGRTHAVVGAAIERLHLPARVVEGEGQPASGVATIEVLAPM
jgi:ABC-type nitrate/sulfonate/bicarbonate transport system substrate-binding protein